MVNGVNSICPGCKIVLPYKEELQHYQTVGIARYGVVSPECAVIFLEVLNNERELFGYPPAHRLIVDAYAVQHPPHSQIQAKLKIEKRLIDASIQSISIHLLALYCSMVKKMELQSIAKIMDTILSNMTREKVTFELLTPPENLGDIKVIDIETQMLEKNLDIDAYTALAYSWAESSWIAWKVHHVTIKKLYDKYAH